MSTKQSTPAVYNIEDYKLNYRACIPLYVLLDNRLSGNEKILYGLIEQMESSMEDVFINDRSLCHILGVSFKSRILGKMQRKLKDFGYIKRCERLVKLDEKTFIASCWNTTKRSMMCNSESPPVPEVPTPPVPEVPTPPVPEVPTYNTHDLKAHEYNKNTLGDSSNTPSESKPVVTQSKSSKPSKDYKQNPLFMKFYTNYPKKIKPHDAYKAFIRLNPDDVMIDMIIADTLKRRAKDDHWQEIQFIPYPASYLNARYWEGEVCDSDAERLNKKVDAKKISDVNFARIEKASLEQANKSFITTKEAVIAKKIIDQVTKTTSGWSGILKSIRG